MDARPRAEEPSLRADPPVERPRPRTLDLTDGTPRGLSPAAIGRLYRSLVEGSGDLVVAFDDDGTMVFVNEASAALVGYAPDELMGRNVFDFVHPDDMDRAMRALELNRQFGSAPGTTAFRLARADGTWVFVDMTGGHATDDGERVLFSSFSRRADDRFAMSETLVRLLDGSPLADALRPVCDTFAWQANGSQIGIVWHEPDGRHAVTTGIHRDLVGAGPDVEGSPWQQVRATGEGVVGLDLSGLGPADRRLARAAGMGAYWIEPIASGAGEHALLTVWTREGARPPANHALAMETARPIVELILRWAEQQRQLDHAAFHDPLTGVANRKRFFDELAASTTGGAVLYCDLDRFKAVNDRLGHAAGDELLRLVAARMQGCVRGEDIVARLGGDEFAVLCPGASTDVAIAIADRIEDALTQPFVVRGESVEIGTSIGIGHSPDRVGDETLDAADRGLYRVKSARQGDAPPPSR